MLLLAHLGRAEVPRGLQADARFLLQKAPLLLEEMVKIANLPRPPAGFGWLSPTVGSLEMMQCLTRAQALAARKALGQGGKARPAPPPSPPRARMCGLWVYMTSSRPARPA
jgi:translocation protein SEC63